MSLFGSRFRSRDSLRSPLADPAVQITTDANLLENLQRAAARPIPDPGAHFSRERSPTGTPLLVVLSRPGALALLISWIDREKSALIIGLPLRAQPYFPIFADKFGSQAVKFSWRPETAAAAGMLSVSLCRRQHGARELYPPREVIEFTIRAGSVIQSTQRELVSSEDDDPHDDLSLAIASFERRSEGNADDQLPDSEDLSPESASSPGQPPVKPHPPSP